MIFDDLRLADRQVPRSLPLRSKTRHPILLVRVLPLRNQPSVHLGLCSAGPVLLLVFRTPAQFTVRTGMPEVLPASSRRGELYEISQEFGKSGKISRFALGMVDDVTRFS